MIDSREVRNFYVRPCVEGNSTSGQYFNFSVTVSKCLADNCTALNTQPGASIISPILLSLAGISGQICALIYLHRSSRASRHQRTTFYVMLATLIWTDLIGKVITTPLPVLSYVKGHWVGGGLTCNIHGFSMSLIAIVTHLLVAVMALERYLGIRCGYFYNRNVTTSRTRMTLIGIWIFGAMFCSLPFIGIGEFKLHYPGTWCHINQHICTDQSLEDKFFANLYSSLNLLCFCIIVFCNLVVVGSLLKMRVTKFRPSQSSRDMSMEKKLRETEIQMVILLVVITITFIVSWAAHDLLMITNQIWPAPPNQNPLLDIKAIRLVSLNQIIDPWSYIICRIIFRSQIWKCCQRVFIGKLNARRFSSKGDEGSVFSSVAIRNKFAKIHKRTSLPNPKDITVKAIATTDQHSFESVYKSSFEQSLTSDSDQGSRARLDRTSKMKNKSSIGAAFAKLFKTSKDETYIQIDSPEEETIKKNVNIVTPPNERQFKGTHSLTHKKTVSSISGCYHGGEDSVKQYLLDQKVSDSTGISITNLPVRSNSWCCSDEYTSRNRR